jgi:hypothetical protein
MELSAKYNENSESAKTRTTTTDVEVEGADMDALRVPLLLHTGVPELRKSSITCLLKISTFTFF